MVVDESMTVDESMEVPAQSAYSCVCEQATLPTKVGMVHNDYDAYIHQTIN